jgi:YHS domain-containing protein
MSTRFMTRASLAIALGAGLSFAAGCSKEDSHSGHDHAASSSAKTPAASPAPAQDNAAVIQAQLPTYPLQTCVVSGDKLGEMGNPVDYVHEGRLVRFCCSGCIAKFKKDPAQYLKMIDDAAAKAKAGGASADAPKPEPVK